MVMNMFVLVACEESQRVMTEFRKKGHTAFSCDILETSGNYPQYHILGDVVPLLNGFCSFKTQDGKEHRLIGKWDLIIAFPPCTFLTVTGNRWFDVEKYGEKAKKRIEERKKAIEFFETIASADCKKIAIENPVGIMSTIFRKPDQIVNPWMFGDAFEKRTCLWLKNLPQLEPTDIVDIPPRVKFESGKSMPKWYADLWNLPKEERAKERSKTFIGIARAMAERWG